MEGNSPPLFCLLIKNTWQKLSRYYNQRLSKYDLTVQKALLLLEIPPGSGKNPRSLAKELDLENSSISGLLDRLEKQGLIERQKDPNDRRGILIYLTPEGLTARQTITSLVEELDRKLQTELSSEDIKVFRRTMSVINKQI
ncbi:MAG TPA: MarR family transcriptional regulator [Bacillota bacterium]|nr:MarR family transcriptional regulator [Bacillota bacterium]HOL09583.1 MarR family transcriptional regulator [Bacillota bacterium]HPO97256.1 MarR family transcriptional regulator [Bacillota bacterium]